MPVDSKLIFFYFVLAAVLVAMTFISCEKDDPVVRDEVADAIPYEITDEIPDISLNKTSLELMVGSEETLTYIIKPENATSKEVIWRSSNPAIATVNNGKIKGISPGEATITAAVERWIYATCNVKVIFLTKNIQLNEPGTLKDLISLEELPKIGYLSISGPLNGTDIFIIREKMTSLVNLNMENARIVSGGMPYYMQQTTTDNTIGNDMFSQQKTLESIILPKTIKSIGDYAFKGCSNLKSIYIKNPIPIKIALNTFEGVSKTDCTLFVPTGSFESYWFAFGWSEFQNIKEMDF